LFVSNSFPSLPTNMQEILSIRGLSKSYKNVRAIQNLDLQILEGQAYGILGPNGSGKTTTFDRRVGISPGSGKSRWPGREGASAL